MINILKRILTPTKSLHFSWNEFITKKLIALSHAPGIFLWFGEFMLDTAHKFKLGSEVRHIIYDIDTYVLNE